jgi:hypothetical protein
VGQNVVTGIGGATGRARVPAVPSSVTSWIDTVPQTQRRYRTQPCEVWWVDSTAVSSMGHPHCGQLMSGSRL